MMMQPVYDGKNLALLQSHLSQPLSLLKKGLFQCPAHLEKTINNSTFIKILSIIFWQVPNSSYFSHYGTII